MLASLRTTIVCFLLLTLTMVSAASVTHKREGGLSYGVNDGENNFSPVPNHLMARQTAGKTTLCYPYTVYLQENGANVATIRNRTCYCNVNGTLTPATVNDINTAFAQSSTAINQTAFSRFLTTNSLTRAQGVSQISGSLQAALNARTATCVYPPGVTPTSCTSCAFTCPRTTQKQCGSTCVPTAQACSSAVPVKRDVETKHCRTGWDVCETGLVGFGGKSVGWECVNTQSDLESCGGCIRPTQGKKAGTDCTAIAGANGVSCVSGSCEVASCLRGFRLENNSCIPVTRAASSIASPASSASSTPSHEDATSAPQFVQEQDLLEPFSTEFWTEELKPSEPGQHKVWHKRTTKATNHKRQE